MAHSQQPNPLAPRSVPLAAVEPAACPPTPTPTPATATATVLPLAHRRNRVMWLNNDRVFYAGLLGAVSVRTMGGWLVYASLGAPLRICVGDAATGTLAADAPWQSTDLAVVPPYTPHRVACDERLICSITIEPETVDEAALPAWLHAQVGAVPAGHPEAARMLQRVRTAHAWLCSHGRSIDLQTSGFDECFFGRPLAPRRLDPRIAGVLEDMRNDPSRSTTAQECATAVGLSFSRFLHLFKAEVGTPFRSLRTWKRARSLLHHVTRDTNLVHVALDTGYPDSTHFSHSIRQVYGLKPRDLFAGSRALTVLGDSPAARAAARAEGWR
jgi:AraC-like DNA-binding protein